MADQTDLLELTQNYLTQELVPDQVNDIQILDHVAMVAKEASFPVIGILDGGDAVEEGVSEDIEKEYVFIAAYTECLGERKAAVLNARKILKNARALIENQENFYSTGVFNEWNSVHYRSSSEGKTAGKKKADEYKNDDDYIVIKIMKLEFRKHVAHI